MDFHAIIPAGGSGTRLWPLSRRSYPKFLLPLPGPLTMIQETAKRLHPLAPSDRLLIVAGAAHYDPIHAQLPELPPQRVIVEPAARGTGPAIGLGVALLARDNPQTVVGSFAADHHVSRPGCFQRDVRAAIEVARKGYLVTIGIRPEYPETGYGYIEVGDEIGTFKGRPAHRVARFKEKPDTQTASRYVESGSYLWNASMFVWRSDVLLSEMRRLLPELYSALECIVRAWDSPERQEVFEAVWQHIADVTIDHGILEHSGRVAVIPSDMGWTDLGDWRSVGALRASSDGNNVVDGADLVAIDSACNIIHGGDKMIGLIGVDNLVIVDTKDALLICNRSYAQDVKAIVEQLRDQGRTQLL